MFSFCHTENTPVCTVCYEDKIHKFLKALPCGHKFHKKCIKPWAKSNNSCPVCRKAINPNKPIEKCVLNTENEDHELAIRLQRLEFNAEIIDEINWICADCNNNPCVCERAHE